MPLPLLPTVEAAKRLAAYAAVDDHIDLDQKVGLLRMSSDEANARLSVLDPDRLYPTLWTVSSNKV